MIIRFTHSYYFILLCATVLLSACRSSKGTSETKEPPKDRSASYLLKRYDRNKFVYDWVGMKIDADFVTMGESQGFKASIRMKKDSAIWISISPALGIEVFRILITPDSLKYLSKIPENKFYYIGTSASLSELAKIDLDFDMLQDILMGNAIGLEKDEGKFRTSVDGFNYLLTSKYKRKVKRVVGIDDRRLSPTDTIVVNPNDPRYQRSLRRADEDELIVSRYWLESENFRMVRSVFNDLVNQRAIDISYADFKQEGEQFYPARCVMKLAEASRQEELSFKITKLVTDKTYEFPFEIPEGFEKKQPN
jgi:hypothetical protein